MRRFYFVDLLRGFAAITVLICHYTWFFARHPMDWRFDAPVPAREWLWPAYVEGGKAVELFWILSGFVFWVAYGTRGVTAKEFWVHRVARLYPLHFITLCVVAVLQAISIQQTGQPQVYPNNDLPHFALQLFMASNWFTMEPSFNGPIWSVSVEVLIYFTFLAFLQRPSLWLAISCGFAAFVIERITHHPIAVCAALFYGGVIIGMVLVHLERWTLALGIAGLCLTALALWAGGPKDFLLIYAGAPSLLLLFIGLDSRFELPRQFHWIGFSTYSIYLWHMPVLIALRLTVGIVPLPVFAALVIGLSVLSYRWIELPAQRYIRKIGSRLGTRTRTPGGNQPVAP